MRDGIRLWWSCCNNTFTGNRILDAKTYGINVSTIDCRENTFMGNAISGCANTFNDAGSETLGLGTPAQYNNL